MRRTTLLLASSLAAAAIAGVLVYGSGLLLDSPDLRAASRAVEFVNPEATAPQLTSSADTEPNVSASEPPGTTVAQDVQTQNPPPDDRASRRSSGPPPDEATIHARIRRSTTEDVLSSYSLLLDELDLTPQEREDLLALLIELQLEATTFGSRDGVQRRGRTIGAQERHERIAAVIGDEKLDELLLLEVNRGAYWETQQITSLLQRRGVPLGEGERDRVFDMLVEVRARYPEIPPPDELDPRSIEHLEHTLTQLDEFDRHVVELAPSVLSPTQVVHLSDAYQTMSRDRANDLVRQEKRRADHPGEDLPWGYPGRWANYR